MIRTNYFQFFLRCCRLTILHFSLSPAVTHVPWAHVPYTHAPEPTRYWWCIRGCYVNSHALIHHIFNLTTLCDRPCSRRVRKTWTLTWMVTNRHLSECWRHLIVDVDRQEGRSVLEKYRSKAKHRKTCCDRMKFNACDGRYVSQHSKHFDNMHVQYVVLLWDCEIRPRFAK